MRHPLLLLTPILAALVASCGSDSTDPAAAGADSGTPGADVGNPADSKGETASDGPALPDPSAFASAPASCSFQCPPTGCAEATAPYACPSLGPWATIPHAETCGAWDGTFPTPKPGSCSATAPKGEAAKYAGADTEHPGTRILPDGRRIRPGGSEWRYDEADLPAGLPSAILPIPGSSYAVTVDTGYGDHAVRLVDTNKIGAGNPVVAYVRFPEPQTLNSGVAFVAPDLVYVSTSYGVVQALAVDTKNGTLRKDDKRSLKLPKGVDRDGNPIDIYSSGVAASPDGKRLVVTGVFDKRLILFDVGAGSATFGAKLGEVELGSGETFGAFFDPNDTEGSWAYVTLWGGRAVLEVDLRAAAAPKVGRRFKTDKNPEGVAFLDARWMAVANDFGDTISLVDRVAGTATTIPVDVAPGAHGLEPSSLAYDAANKRLYAALAGINAIGAWSVDVTTTPPKLTPLGRLPTSWWPGGVAVLGDGALVVASMRGTGTGSRDPETGIMPLVRGGVQKIPAPSAGDLVAGEATVRAANAVAEVEGAPKVECPMGTEYDFPIPATNTTGPSKAIRHVFFIVRENKTFDGLFGDLAGVEGRPTYTLKKTSAEMERVWPNTRALARAFTISDNYYTSAELSIQGHVWTTYGRSSDFNERTWAMDGDGRNARPSPVPASGIADVGQPEEGSLFDWLATNKVGVDVLGEAVGSPRVKLAGPEPIDLQYPGGFVQSIDFPDIEKACYAAGRIRVRCDARPFVYQTLPNDHTSGVSAARPTPEVMIAVNDEATGVMIDAISHSPIWGSSLVVITEDDPAQGGDHIDAHRAPLVVISPWVKRGYVSKTHIDIASLHKLFAHVFGLPYPNVVVVGAGLPFDMFTSTPDYTPYEHKTRVWPLACGGPASMAERRLTASWDFAQVDEQPGLDAQVERWMRGKQLETLSQKMEREVAERLRRRIERVQRIERIERGESGSSGARRRDADD